MQEHIENRIFTLRGVQVMIDFHLAELYQVETRALNQAVKRNAERFPKDFMFQLTKEEWLSVQSQIVLIERQNLKSQIVTSSEHGGRRKLPFVFTEQGVASLSGVLKSETATNVFIAIMRAFISMRKLLLNNASIFQRLDIIELKQIETNKKFEQVVASNYSKFCQTREEAQEAVIEYVKGTHPSKKGISIPTHVVETGNSKYPFVVKRIDGKLMKGLGYLEPNQF